MSYEVVNISLDLIESYSTKVADSINYFGSFSTE
jgi:hypothetical protein